MLRSPLAAAAIVLAVGLMSPAFAQETKTIPRIISMTGHGEVRMAPDRAVVNIGVHTSSGTAEEAMKANREAMNSVFAKLKAAGITERDIQTSDFSVQPRYDYNDSNQPPKLTGYDVTNMVAVTVQKLDGLGPLLDSVVSSGSNQINGISLQVSNPDQALDEARKIAVKDAARKAQIYASAANVRLGAVQSISEGTGLAPPIPVQAKTMRADNVQETPIAPGEQALAIDVNIVWEIE